LKKICYSYKLPHDAEGHFETWRPIFIESMRNNFEVFQFQIFPVDAERLHQLVIFLKENQIELVFFEWLHDFILEELLLFDGILTINKIKWCVHADVSTFFRKSNHIFYKNPGMNVVASLKHTKSLISISSWDTFLCREIVFLDNIPIFGLSDFQEVNTKLDLSDYRKIESSRLKIGLVGQLYDYRGTLDIIEWARSNPELDFVLAGVAKDTTKKQLKDGSLQLISNLSVDNRFLPDDFAIDRAILGLDILYISTKTYPVSSGIALRARHMGIEVLIDDSDSFLRDMSSIDFGITLLPEKVVNGYVTLADWVYLNYETKNKSTFAIPAKVDVINSYADYFKKL
jgi:hypothetical protein